MQIRQLRQAEASPNPALTQYVAARNAYEQAKRHLEECQRQLADQMQTDSTKQLNWFYDGREHVVTYVATKRYEIDEKGLRKALTAKVFDRFTVKKLDRKALEKAMDDGEVDPMVVARFVSELENKPYLRYTERDES